MIPFHEWIEIKENEKVSSIIDNANLIASLYNQAYQTVQEEGTFNEKGNLGQIAEKIKYLLIDQFQRTATLGRIKSGEWENIKRNEGENLQGILASRIIRQLNFDPVKFYRDYANHLRSGNGYPKFYINPTGPVSYIMTKLVRLKNDHLKANIDPRHHYNINKSNDAEFYNYPPEFYPRKNKTFTVK